MARIISTDGAFSEPHKKLLALLADMMIPAADDLPSAADPAIFARALQGMSSSADIIGHGLAALEEHAAHRSKEGHKDGFATLNAADRTILIEDLKGAEPAFMQTLQACVVVSYYQDDRVLLALGLPARPPHPGGYEMPATDWTLLDPVRQRKPFYKDV